MKRKAQARLAKLKTKLKRAQVLIRKHVKHDVSLSDELIAERRAAARKE